jgi:hypothetical protein
MANIMCQNCMEKLLCFCYHGCGLFACDPVCILVMHLLVVLCTAMTAAFDYVMMYCSIQFYITYE